METLVIGKISKPQGIRGELKVVPYTDSGEDFRRIKRVFIGEEEYRVLTVRTSPDAVFLGLRGIADRNAAELLRGKELSIPREEAPEPAEGSYYIADLLGCEIVTESGERLGVLKAITQAATDVYTMYEGEREILFPAADGVIVEVRTEEKKLIVDKRRFFEVAVL